MPPASSPEWVRPWVPQEADDFIALAGVAALLDVIVDAQLAAAFGADDLVPAGAEGVTLPALADALEERAQQALGLGVEVEAVGDGGIAQSAAEDLQRQLCHRAGRQLGAALIAGALKGGHGEQIVALGQQHKVGAIVFDLIVPAKGAVAHSNIFIRHKYFSFQNQNGISEFSSMNSSHLPQEATRLPITNCGS